jgi:hypothetical protein
VQTKFEETSEISLPGFLRPEKFAEVLLLIIVSIIIINILALSPPFCLLYYSLLLFTILPYWTSSTFLSDA